MRNGGVNVEVKHRVKEARKAIKRMKSVLKCRTLNIDARRRLFEMVVVPIAVHGAEALDMKAVDRRRLDVLEMK